MNDVNLKYIWISCHFTCFCYQLIKKPGYMIAPVSWPKPHNYIEWILSYLRVWPKMKHSNTVCIVFGIHSTYTFHSTYGYFQNKPQGTKTVYKALGSMAAMLIKRAAHWARSNLPPSGLNSIWRQDKLYEYAQVVCVDDIHEFIFHPAWSMKDIFHFIDDANPSEWYLGFLTKSPRYPRNGQQEKKTNL